MVRERTSKNAELPTGDVELAVSELRILSKSETPPFAIEENSKVSNETRLKYRYLDLRRPDMQRILTARHRIVKAAHEYFDDNGFLEIETLTSSNPHRKVPATTWCRAVFFTANSLPCRRARSFTSSC